MAMTSAPTHHPDSELLLARAAGRLEPAIALVVSAHLDMCPRCAARSDMLDMVGGAVLEQTLPAEMAPDALDKILERLDGEEAGPAITGRAISVEKLKSVGLEQIPHTLRPLAANAAETHGWKKLLGGVSEFLLRKDSDGTELRFLLIPPGTGVPRHTHAGLEFTLVIKGAYRDETGVYGPGDLSVASPELTHRPVAREDGPCLAFAVTNAPLRFTGALGLIQRGLGGG